MKRLLMLLALYAGGAGADPPNVSTEIRDVDALSAVVDLAQTNTLGLSDKDHKKLLALGASEVKQQQKNYDKIMKDQCKRSILDRPVDQIDVAAITAEWAATDRETEARWAGHRNALDHALSPEGQQTIANLIDELKTNGQLSVANPNFQAISAESPAEFAAFLQQSCKQAKGDAMGVGK